MVEFVVWLLISRGGSMQGRITALGKNAEGCGSQAWSASMQGLAGNAHAS